MVSSWAAPVTYLKEGGDKMKAERILTGTRGISDPEGGGERARSPPPRAVSWRTLESQAMTLRDLKGFLFQPAPMVCRWGNGGPETTRASLSSHQGLGAQPGRDAGSVLQLARGGLAVEGDSGKPSGVSSA